MFEFRRTLDIDKNGKVDLAEAFQKAPQLLKKIYERLEPGPYDWCQMTDAQGNVFYYNKRVSGITCGMNECMKGFDAGGW